MTVVRVADSVISPLGLTTEENLQALLEGASGIAKHDHSLGMPTPFCASMFTDSQWRDLSLPGQHTRFERLLIHSIAQAVSQTDINVSSPRLLFIISTTKGNVELLDAGGSPESISIASSAAKVARYFHNGRQPIVVSNACISGLSAQIVAMRALQAGLCDVAIVSGCDVLSRFIVSGFQSLKALSDEPCRPYDMERHGLNLGEAAATIIYRRADDSEEPQEWMAEAGFVRNDASHISNPSRTAEGLMRALNSVVKGFDKDRLALINTHGTATLYNDEMEAVALKRTQMSQVAVNSLKGYYGHTMGAAGILETVMTMHATDSGVVLATKGFQEMGVSAAVNVASVNRPTSKHAFVKVISGFGGGNAAMLFRKGGSR